MRIKLTDRYTLFEILSATSGKGRDIDNRVIEYISTDTREIYPGDLFFPLCGKNYSGEDFVDEAKSRGAIALSQKPGSQIIIDNGLDALIRLSIYHLSRCRALRYKIAITGSVGKTSVKEFTKFILSSSIKTHQTKHNYNNSLGLCHTLLTTPTDSEALVVEMGMNAPGEISEMSKMLAPNIGVITNIGSSHIGMLGSREKIALAKSEICDGIKDGVVLCPHNEPLLSKLDKKLTVSSLDSGADFYFKEHAGGVTLYHKDGIAQNINIPASLTHIKESVYFAIAIGYLCSLEQSAILDAVCRLSPVSSRGSFVNYGDFRFYDDSYNSSPESVISDLKMLVSSCQGGVSALLGDILELGSYSEQIHRDLGKSVADFQPSHLFLFGNYAYAVAEGAVSEGYDKNKIFINPDLSDPQKTALDIYKNCGRGETVLMKASHSVDIKRVALLLEEIKNYD